MLFPAMAAATGASNGWDNARNAGLKRRHAAIAAGGAGLLGAGTAYTVQEAVKYIKKLNKSKENKKKEK